MTAFFQYLKTVAILNKLPRDIQWLFHPGMLFLSRDKWWGDFKYRATAHEGIDITFFRRPDEPIEGFKAGFKVPAFCDGTVVNICSDFLGKSLVVDYPLLSSQTDRVILVYSHIDPLHILKPGSRVQKESIIATVSDTIKNPQLPPHLHLSCFEIPDLIPDQELNWNLFSKHDQIRMINPVFL